MYVPPSMELSRCPFHGPSRAGKTKLALKLRELGWDHIQHHSQSTTESLQSALRSSLEAGRDVVVDSLNLTKAQRHQWLSVAGQAMPKAADGSSGISQFVVISAMNPTGQDVRFCLCCYDEWHTDLLPASLILETFGEIICTNFYKYV